MNYPLITLLLLAGLTVGCGDSQPRHAADGDEPAAHAGEPHDDGHGHEDADDHDGHGHDDQALRAHIPAQVARDSGIVVAAAESGVIRDEHVVQGLLTTIEGRHARIEARFPGPIRQVDAAVGDAVKQGQTLAVVESNVSLSNYAISAPFAGTVLARSAAVGEMAGDAPLFEIADLSRLWVDLHVFGADATHIRAGLPVEVSRLSDGKTVQTTIDRVLPATATRSQSTIARAVIANEDDGWRPGAAVRARITVAEQPVAVRVPLSALQQMDGRDVVFVQAGDAYAAQPVRLGRRDARHVEVLDGIAVGMPVVSEQSFLIKADIEKESAAHEH